MDTVEASLKFLGKQIAAGAQFGRQFASRQQTAMLWMGMGGSALGAQIWQSYISQKNKTPFWVWSQPTPPGFLISNTTVVVASYSGQTQETIHFYQQIRKQHLRILGLTGGGPLAKLFQQDKIPFFRLPGNLNPSGQPRYGVGFSLGFLIGLHRFIYPLAFKTAKQAPSFSSPPLESLLKFFQHHPFVFLLARPLFWGLGQFWQNQLQETAKYPACFVPDPDARHHLPEALRSPAGLLFLFSPRQAFAPWLDWADKKKIAAFHWRLPPLKSKISRILWGMNAGQYFAFHLARREHQQPAKIPEITALKRETYK